MDLNKVIELITGSVVVLLGTPYLSQERKLGISDIEIDFPLSVDGVIPLFIHKLKVAYFFP